MTMGMVIDHMKKQIIDLEHMYRGIALVQKAMKMLP